MSYFLPTFLQKRLLRYVLSRLEIVDTDALGLDKLDITWGKRSTLELRDVGIHGQKLATLLRLPKICSLSKAKIERLRLTIPADLHQSGILVEFHGLIGEIDLHLHDQCTRHIQKDGKSDDAKAPSTANDSDRARRSQPLVHDPGGWRSSSHGIEEQDHLHKFPDQLPTTENLAESFLQRESEDEKKALETALFKSQVLGCSEPPDVGGDGSQELGIGSAVSMPGFLADFLKGVAERVQILFEGIMIDFVLQWEAPRANHAEDSARRQVHGLTFRLVIAHADLTDDRSASTMGQEGVDKDSQTNVSSGSRQVRINNAQVMLLSDTPSLSRMHPPPSISPLRATQSAPSVPSLRNHSKFPNAELGASIYSSGAFAPDLNMARPSTPNAIYQSHSIQNAQNSSKPPSPAASSSIVGKNKVPVRTNIAGSSINGSLNYLNDDCTHQRSKSGPTPSSDGKDLPSEDYSFQFSHHQALRTLSSKSMLGRPQPTFNNLTKDTPSVDDLTESRFYTHDEAVSMYMSALDTSSPETHVTKLAIPGAWEYQAPHDKPCAKQQKPQEYLFESETNINQSDPMLSDRPHLTERREESPVSITVGLESVSPSTFKTMQPSFETVNDSIESSQSGTASATAKPLISLSKIEVQLSKSTEGYRDVSSAPVPSLLAKKRCVDAGMSAAESQQLQVLKLHVESIELLGDMTVTKTLILILQQMSLLNTDKVTQTPSSAEALNVRIELDFQHVAWRFVNSIKGQECHERNILQRPYDFTVAETDTLLRAEFQRLKLSHSAGILAKSSKFSIGKIWCGYVNDELIWFDADPTMRESNRESTADDVSATLKMPGPDSNFSFDLVTLPLCVHLDLRRLDETFGWLGGLSSVLEMGNSVASTITHREAGQPTLPLRAKRTVRFGSPERHPASSNPTPRLSNRVNVRISSLFVKVEGEMATVRVSSSAVKLVKRSEGVGIQIDRMNVAGPYLNNHKELVSCTVRLSNVRTEYLSVPKQVDLTRLIELVFPSKLRDEDQFKDGLMVDTLLRQRRQGGVIRVTVDEVEGSLRDMAALHLFRCLLQDMKKLSTVAKYLPEDDRPGILVLSLIRKLSIEALVNEQIGSLNLKVTGAEAAFVTIPSLIALGIRKVRMNRNDGEELLSTSVSQATPLDENVPIILARYIGNEMEPLIRIRVHGLRLEYRVSTLVALSSLESASSSENLLVDLPRSIATLTGKTASQMLNAGTTSSGAESTMDGEAVNTLPRVDVLLKTVLVGLNPFQTSSKGYIVVDDTLVSTRRNNPRTNISLEVSKAAMMIIDSVKFDDMSASGQITEYHETLQKFGYVPVATLLAPKVELQICMGTVHEEQTISADIISGLLILETCADSTQTLQVLASQLTPPAPESTEPKYRTEAISVKDMLSSFTGDAFTADQNVQPEDQSPYLELNSGDTSNHEVDHDNDPVSHLYGSDPSLSSRVMTYSMLEEGLETIASPSTPLECDVDHTLPAQDGKDTIAADNPPLHFVEDHFADPKGARGLLDALSNPLRPSILEIHVQGFHIIWNLFDGYDWFKTRHRIGEAVADVQNKAAERNGRIEKGRPPFRQDQDEDVIGDFLFNSIYIGIPAKAEPASLPQQVNWDLDDHASETESQPTSTQHEPTRLHYSSLPPRNKRLRLGRGKHHKMTFELKGVSCDIVTGPATGEKQSTIDLRVHDLEIFDHVPTSTWKKFATYMHDAGERESEKPMIWLRLDNVRPVIDLAATEIVIKVSLENLL